VISPVKSITRAAAPVRRRGAATLALFAAFFLPAQASPDACAADSTSPSAAAQPSGPASAGSAAAPDGFGAPTREAPRYLLDRLAAGASLGYFDTHPGRILSRINFDFPFLVIRRKSLYVRGELQSSTVKTGETIQLGSFTQAFQAQDLEYLFEAGARDYLNNRVAISAFVGQQGREELDRRGYAWLRYFGLGFESVGFPRPGGEHRFEWRLALGPSLQEAGSYVPVDGGAPVPLKADAFVRGAFLLDLWRTKGYSIGLDVSIDTIFEGHHDLTEYRIGPRWTLPLQNGVRFALFSEYIHSGNPLGQAGLQGWNFGVKYAEGAYTGPRTQTLPDIRGVLALGTAWDRGFGRLDLDLSSPEFRIAARSARVFANLDANAVAGSGVDTLFYIATAGADVQVSPRIVLGADFYHRSNHGIGESAGGSTSVNMFQAIARTNGWDYADRSHGRLMPGPDVSWTDRIEGFLAPGYATDSSFENGTGLDLQAGLRVDLLPRSSSVVPFVRLFADWGGADLVEASAGITTRQNLAIEARYRRDEQYLGDEHSDTLLLVSLFF
jgi:hypothetical protein